MNSENSQCFRPSRAFIGVGSNAGDRMGYITEAAECLLETQGIRSLRCAPIYETRPVGPSGPDNFLNTVFSLEVCLSPLQLLHALHATELLLGRPAAPSSSGVGARAGARPIALDILFYDDLVFQNDELSVPHPHLHRREFVLRPLCELDPEFCHPETGLTVRELLAALPPSDQILGVVAISLTFAHA